MCSFRAKRDQFIGVAKRAQFAPDALKPPPGRLGGGGAASLDVFRAVVENLPDDFSQMPGNGPDCFGVTESRYEPLEFLLEEAVFGAHGRLRGLAEHVAQEHVSLGTAAALVFSALSFRPGLTPIQQLNRAGESNAAASAPASATICCAATTPMPGILTRRATAAL